MPLGLVAVALFAAAAPAIAAESAQSAREWVGFELSPLALNAGRATANSPGAPPPTRYSVAPGLTLRVMQRRWSSWYWTPGQLTLVFGGPWGINRKEIGAPVLLVALQTEVGGIVTVGPHTVVDLGLAAGLGGLGVEFSYDCDGHCVIGGRGVMIAPVVRLARRFPADGWLKAAGLFARVAVPLQTGNFRGYNRGFGVLFLLGIDLAFGARASSAQP